MHHDPIPTPNDAYGYDEPPISTVGSVDAHLHVGSLERIADVRRYVDLLGLRHVAILSLPPHGATAGRRTGAWQTVGGNAERRIVLVEGVGTCSDLRRRWGYLFQPGGFGGGVLPGRLRRGLRELRRPRLDRRGGLIFFRIARLRRVLPRRGARRRMAAGPPG